MSKNIELQESKMQISYRVYAELRGKTILVFTSILEKSAEDFCWNNIGGFAELRVEKVWILK